MVPGARGNEKGHNRENHIYMCLYWKKNLLQSQLVNFRCKSSLGKGNSKLFK
jgi:hypothetical protein